MELNRRFLFLIPLLLFLLAPLSWAIAQNWIGNGTTSTVVPTTLSGTSQALGIIVSGSPAAGQIWSLPCPYTITFPANFAGSPPDGNGRVSCGTSPGITNTYNISIAGSQVGTVALTSSCTATSGTTGTGVTFTTSGGTAKTCNVGQQFSLTAPSPAGAATLIGTPGTGSGNSTTLALTTPAGTQSGDVLVACIANYVGGVPADNTIPAGFAYITGVQGTSCETGGAGGGSACLYSNVLSGAGAGSYTWRWNSTGSFESGILMAYRGLNTSSLVDTGAIGVQSGDVTGTVNVAYGTTTTADLLLTCLGTYPSTGWTSAPSSPVAQIGLIGSSAGNNVMVYAGSQSLAASATGSVTGTLNNATGGFGVLNMPLEIGAGPTTLTEANLGFTLVGHISALP